MKKRVKEAYFAQKILHLQMIYTRWLLFSLKKRVKITLFYAKNFTFTHDLLHGAIFFEKTV